MTIASEMNGFDAASELQFAQRLADAADAITMPHYTNRSFSLDWKANHTEVTEADRDTESAIAAIVLAERPTHGLFGEEHGLVGDASSPWRWIVDPIDGTRGFARKNGEFSVMIGFVEDGEIAVGVVAQPAVRRLTYAVKGQGCWRLDDSETIPTRCRVAAVDTLANSTLTQSRSHEPNSRSKWVDALQPAKIVESYSAGIKLALIARGEADIYLNTYEAFHDWDICAGHILVLEAGGLVTGIGGQALEYGLPGAWQKNGLLATNGPLHPPALRVIAGV